MSTTERRSRAAGAIISAVVLAAVVVWALGQPAPELPADAAGLALLGGAVALYGFDVLLRGIRWRRLLAEGGWAPGVSESTGLVVLGTAGNNVLPARGGDAARAWYCARLGGGSLREAIGSLVAERLLDVVTLVAIYAVVAFGLLRGIDVPDADTSLVAGVLAVTALGLVVAALTVRRSGRARRWAADAAPMIRSTRELASLHGARMLAISAAIWIGDAMVIYLCAHSIGFEISALEALYLLGLAGVFAMIPSGPAFAGTFDAAMLFGASAIGGSEQEALSLLLVSRFALFVPVTLVGLALFAGRYGRLGRPRTEGGA